VPGGVAPFAVPLLRVELEVGLERVTARAQRALEDGVRLPAKRVRGAGWRRCRCSCERSCLRRGRLHERHVGRQAPGSDQFDKSVELFVHFLEVVDHDDVRAHDSLELGAHLAQVALELADVGRQRLLELGVTLQQISEPRRLVLLVLVCPRRRVDRGTQRRHGRDALQRVADAAVRVVEPIGVRRRVWPCA
jgi:hypothetical protein